MRRRLRNYVTKQIKVKIIKKISPKIEDNLVYIELNEKQYENGRN